MTVESCDALLIHLCILFLKDKGDVTCIPAEISNVQFESAFLIAQPEVSVLGESGVVFMIPKIHSQDPCLESVFGQGENFLETKPVIT